MSSVHYFPRGITPVRSDPDYDSGWIDMTTFAIKKLSHNLGTIDTVVYMKVLKYDIGEGLLYIRSPEIANLHFWHSKTEESIRIEHIGTFECTLCWMRILMWRIY